MNPARSLCALALVSLLATGCTTVRQLRPAETVPISGKAERTRDKKALDYSIGIAVKAAPELVWAVLTDGGAMMSWNSTLVRFEGTVALGQKVKLVSKVAPDRTFELKVTTFDAPRHMVWEDGGSMFLGVRHFTLLPGGDGGTNLVMSETYSGGMLGMIEGSLPDMTSNFETFAADVKREAERRAGASPSP